MSAFNKQTGFSLLEVLVAFVIMGLVIGVILQLFGTAMRSVTLAEEYTSAIQLAESKLATVGIETPIEAGETSGTDQLTLPYKWTIKITEQEPAALNEKLEKLTLTAPLYQVEARIHWKSGETNREFNLTTLRFGKAP